jgi:dihydrofolate reductase
LAAANWHERFSIQILVDRLRLGVVPVVLGEGITLFPNFPQGDFTLLENKTYSKGLMLLRTNDRGQSPSAEPDIFFRPAHG